MIASLWNPTIQRGGTWSISVSSKDVKGNDFDFSGYDFMRMHVRPSWVGKPGTVKNSPLLVLDTSTSRIVVTQYAITITLTAEETALLNFNSGKFELEMVKYATVGPPATDEIIDKLLYGIMSITGEIIV